MDDAASANERVCEQVMSERAPRAAWRSLAGHTAVVLWAAAMLAVSATLMASHWLAVPAPSPVDPTLQRAATALHASATDRWQLVHVLYAECRCSRRIADYLSEREPLAGVVDTVVWAGAPALVPPGLRARGIVVEALPPEELERRLGIVAAPLLVVIDPQGRVRYVGGHAEPTAARYVDRMIATDLMRGRAVRSLGVSGCAVSRELQSALDPLGVKY